jgi:hypothetical protein
MSRPVSTRRKPHDLSSLSADQSSPTFTPSPRSSHPSNGRATVPESNSFELRTIAPHDEPAPNSEAEDEALNGRHLPRARRASIDSAQSYELYTPDEDRAVLRRLDRKLVLFMALLYCLSFLDRSSE